MIGGVMDQSNDDRSAALAERTAALLKSSGNCAQTSFAILNEEHDLHGEQVLKALTPCPGIALRGETCGAVVGSLMALGLVYGRDDLRDWSAYTQALRPARRFCARFEERYGSTNCRTILEEKLGQSYDLADKAEALHYAVSGGPQLCAELVAYAVVLASESIAQGKRAVQKDAGSSSA